MPTVLTEEDIYQLGFEIFDPEDEKRILQTYSLFLSHMGQMPKYKGGVAAVYPITGNTIPFPFQIIQFVASTPMEIAMVRGACEDNGVNSN